MNFLLLAAYLVPAAILFVFGLNLYFTLILFLRRLPTARCDAIRLIQEAQRTFSDRDMPRVVTQIPLFNEMNVAERIIRAAVLMDYPAGRHHVQVLDDSTDETRSTVDRVVRELHAAGHDVSVVRRPSREGFKAGALQYGISAAPADFYAIFDADFVPPRDFLRQTMAILMMRPDVGIVQARWGHLNASQSFVTRAQGIGIDAHFAVEQPARAWNNLFMNFNGTAGVWRRQAIEDAGGWEHDTLTEDMDLSYRSQLAGWKPYFLFDLVVPAELPDNINAFKAQQFRWAKGSTQTALKLLPRIFRSNASPLAKIQALFHMTHYFIHPLMVWVAFLALPVVQFTSFRYSSATLAALFIMLVISTSAPITLYVISQALLYKGGWKRLRYLPFLTSLGIGIAISNTRAVTEAVLHVSSPFIRTPKRGDRSTRHYPVRVSFETLFELALGTYGFVAMFLFMHAHRYLVTPFLFLYAWGFTAVGLLSMAHFLSQSRWARADS